MQKILFLIWVADSLLKIFPSTLPPQSPNATLEIACAQNEWESGQLAFRSEVPIQKLTARATALQSEDGQTLPAQSIRCQFVGMIPIEHNTPHTAAQDLVCQAPAQVPDVLRDDPQISVAANFTQPIWITVHVPKGAQPGVYRGEIRVDADGEVKTIPLAVTVFNFALPDERHFYMTNWFDARRIATAHQVEFGSDAYFQVLSEYAKNMAEHRQNVFLVSPWLIRAERQKDGALRFDFAQFDRFVQTFFDAGVKDRIEISHVAHHGEGGWDSKEIILSDVTVHDSAQEKDIKLPPEEGLGPMLSALQNHLEEKGWLERSMLHVCDEPAIHNIEPWKKASQFVGRYAPKIKRIDAIETTDVFGLLEVWVPKLNHLRNWEPIFNKARAEGNELWYYICLHPTGVWMNRFLDYPLIKVRLLHWLNYRYELPGYLHWGLNFWEEDPFAAPQRDLPPGDTHTIYPGDGKPLNSLRWEAQRDSAEDFEYLWLLQDREAQALKRLGVSTEEFDPKTRSLELSRTLVQTYTEYAQEPERLRAVRRQLAQEIESTLQEPMVILETYPTEDMPILSSPNSIEIYGVTHPSATVVIDDREIDVDSHGKFHYQTWGGTKQRTVEVNVKHQGKEKRFARTFEVQMSE